MGLVLYSKCTLTVNMHSLFILINEETKAQRNAEHTWQSRGENLYHLVFSTVGSCLRQALGSKLVSKEENKSYPLKFYWKECTISVFISIETFGWLCWKLQFM